jgi:transposase
MSKLYHSRKWLEQQRRAGKTIAEIAKQCDVSYQMIDVYLKKWNIK